MDIEKPLVPFEPLRDVEDVAAYLKCSRQAYSTRPQPGLYWRRLEELVAAKLRRAIVSEASRWNARTMKRSDLRRGQAVARAQLTEGEHGLRRDLCRPISFIPFDGGRSYLRVGTVTCGGRGCFDTVEGEATLRPIAERTLPAPKVRASVPETAHEE